MGEVYRAKDMRLGREVAVKVLPAEFATDSERLRRFEQEARATAALDHPNILAVFDIGTHEGTPYIVEQLLEGESLRQRLRSGPLTPAKAVEFGVQIAQGLAAAHEKGIVHRDLKPENLWITEDGHVKILDFGLARLRLEEASRPEGRSEALTADSPTQEGRVLGTPGYMAPEQVRGKPVDARTDIFAFGVVLYEMLMGKAPFKRASTADTLSAILNENPPPASTENASLSPALVRLLDHCLDKAPGSRFQSAKDLAFALESLSGTSGVNEAASGTQTERQRFGRRMLLLSWLAVAVLLIAAGAGIFFLGRRTSKSVFPKFTALTYQKGHVVSARFSMDGNTVYYSAAWGTGLVEVYAKRLDTVESQPLGIERGEVLSVSAGEMAVLIRNVETLGQFTLDKGTLVRVPLSGGPPRPFLDDVVEADYAPGTTDLAVILQKGKGRVLEFPLGKALHAGTVNLDHLRFSPTGEFISFRGSLEGVGATRKDLILADRKGFKRVLLSDVGDLKGLAWGQDGKEIYLTQSGELRAVGLNGHVRRLAVTTLPLTIRDVSPSGTLLVTQDRERYETYGLLAGDTKQRELSYLNRTVPYTLSADGTSWTFSDRGVAFWQKADGTSPLRLGTGGCPTLSPDGRWAAVGQEGVLRLLPTGAGTPVTLPKGNLDSCFGATWVPPGRRLLVTASGKEKIPDMFVQDLPGGLPRPLANTGVTSLFDAVSPDGRWTTAYRWDDPSATYAQYPIDGGAPKPIPGLRPGDHPVEYSEDGRHLFMYEPPPGPVVHVARLDLTTGRREPWLTISPADPAGISNVWHVRITRNGRYYAVCYVKTLSDLYLLGALK